MDALLTLRLRWLRVLLLGRTLNSRILERSLHCRGHIVPPCLDSIAGLSSILT